MKWNFTRHNWSRTAAVVLALALIASPAVAQNLEGPGAANFGPGSNGQTGGQATGAAATQPTVAPTAARRGPRQQLYNYVPNTNRVTPRGASGYGH